MMPCVTDFVQFQVVRPGRTEVAPLVEPLHVLLRIIPELAALVDQDHPDSRVIAERCFTSLDRTAIVDDSARSSGIDPDPRKILDLSSKSLDCPGDLPLSLRSGMVHQRPKVVRSGFPLSGVIG